MTRVIDAPDALLYPSLLGLLVFLVAARTSMKGVILARPVRESELAPVHESREKYSAGVRSDVRSPRLLVVDRQRLQWLNTG